MKEGSNLVSVIIPVYNAEKFLKKSIESVTKQSYKNIELMLINDGSTDDSEKICNAYVLADKRIKVISQKRSGPSGARNTGIRHAQGTFVFFLDADDFIDKKTLEILVAKYNQYQPELVMGNFCKLENNGQILKQNVTFGPNDKPFKHQQKILFKSDIADYVRHFLKHPSNHMISYCWAKLYKLSIIKKYHIFAKEDMRLFEDFVFNLEYLKHTNKTVFINKPFYTYVMHNYYVSVSMAIINADSLCHDMNIFKTKTIEFFQNVNNRFNTFDIKKEIGHALTHYAIIFLIRSCRQITKKSRKQIHVEINKLINAPIFMESLQYYSPSKGDSRILPLLAKLKLVKLITLYCKYKAYKRYGKLEVN